MAVPPPPLTRETVQSLYDAAIAAVIAKSEGNITEVPPSSPISAIEEGLAVIGGGIIDRLNQLSTEIERNRLALFGISRKEGSPAIGTIQVTLDGNYVESFVLPQGYQLTAGGVIFETTSNLVIPSYTLSGLVGIVALSIGEEGNLPASTPVSFAPVPKVATISLSGSTNGGVGEETEEQFRERIYSSFRERGTLISKTDFESEAINILGEGSTAVAIPELTPDQTSYEPGYVSVFAINPDGSPLNAAQLSELQSTFSEKAAMATVSVDSLDTFDIDVYVYANFEGNPDLLGEDVKRVVTSYLKPGNLPPGEQILQKAIEFEVQNLPGIIQGLVTVTLNGLEQPQSLPSPWSIGVLKGLTVELIDNQGNTFIY